MPAAPTADRDGRGSRQQDSSGEEVEEDADPFAWAMQDQVEDGSSSAAQAEEPDPFAWAAAQGQSGDGDGGGEDGGSEDDDGSWAKSDEPEFSDTYLEDKYG